MDFLQKKQKKLLQIKIRSKEEKRRIYKLFRYYQTHEVGNCHTRRLFQHCLIHEVGNYMFRSQFGAAKPARRLPVKTEMCDAHLTPMRQVLWFFLHVRGMFLHLQGGFLWCHDAHVTIRKARLTPATWSQLFSHL